MKVLKFGDLKTPLIDQCLNSERHIHLRMLLKNAGHEIDGDGIGIAGRERVPQLSSDLPCSTTPSLTTTFSPDPSCSSVWAVNTLMVGKSSQAVIYGQYYRYQGTTHWMPGIESCLPTMSSYAACNGLYSPGTCPSGWIANSTTVTSKSTHVYIKEACCPR
jgi:hypothetical protein